MSLPSAPVPNSEPSPPTREDQPRCRKRVFSTTPKGPTEARTAGPSGATSQSFIIRAAHFDARMLKVRPTREGGTPKMLKLWLFQGANINEID